MGSICDDFYDEQKRRSEKAKLEYQDRVTGVEDFASKLNSFIAFIESINYTGSVADVTFFVETLKYYARKIKNV